MSFLSMVEANLPPGFRFHPRDDELICDYLMKKFSSSHTYLMIDVDLNKCEPWDIPETACVGGKEWYFYSQRDRKYATGLRTNRATVSGYWKATGKDRSVFREGSLVGMRKTLVFYQGRAPKGRKTGWVMHEFRLEGFFSHSKLPSSKEDWVVCRVFHKSKDVADHHKSSTAVQTTSTSSSFYEEVEAGSSSLPPLMDSYNNISNVEAYMQVPCFSIFNQTFMEPINNIDDATTTTNKNIVANPMISCYSTPAFGTHLQDGILTAAARASALKNNEHEIGHDVMNSVSTCDKHVIKAVMNHLTNMEGSSASNYLKGSSSISVGVGDVASSESY